MTLLTRHLCPLLLSGVVLLSAPGYAGAHAFVAQGTWTADGGQLTGTWRATFDAAGRDAGGIVRVEGMPGVRMGNLRGFRNGTSMSFTLRSNGREAASFQGKLLSGHDLGGTFVTADGITGHWTGSYVRRREVAP
jgi:hypothetical protein